MPTSKKTVLRSIRISAEMEELLRQDAEQRGISVNGLVTAILQKYREWDRYAEKFGFVAITRNGWRMLLEAIEDQRFALLGKEMGAQNPREMTLFWFKKLNTETFLAYLSLISRYAKTMTYELESDGSSYTISLQVDTGHRGAVFWGNFIDQAIRTIVSVVPKVEVGRNSVVASFIRP